MTAMELYAFVVALDVLLAWVQENPAQWPRRLTHFVTEPVLVMVRRGMGGWKPAGWDLSPVVLIVVLTCLKLVMRDFFV